jgi:hypothetical protein
MVVSSDSVSEALPVAFDPPATPAGFVLSVCYKYLFLKDILWFSCEVGGREKH